jgi:hypothetical protein
VESQDFAEHHLGNSDLGTYIYAKEKKVEQCLINYKKTNGILKRSFEK